MAYESLAGKVAIVTGATRSMGGAVAGRLADDDAIVAGLGRSAEAGEKVAADIRERGKQCRFFYADMTCEDSIQSAVRDVVAAYGRLDILVNLAAATDILRLHGGANAIDESTERFDQMMKVNLYGPFWLSKYALPHMITGGGGAIVNISSTSAHRVDRGLLSYVASKAALEGLTKQIASDFSDDGIRANAIILGAIRSSESEYVYRDPVQAASRRANQMLPEPGRPVDVANLVAFLAADESAFITGATVPLEGGLLATYPAPKRRTEVETRPETNSC